MQAASLAVRPLPFSGAEPAIRAAVVMNVFISITLFDGHLEIEQRRRFSLIIINSPNPFSLSLRSHARLEAVVLEKVLISAQRIRGKIRRRTKRRTLRSRSSQ